MAIRTDPFIAHEETRCTTLHVGHFIRLTFVAVISVICFAHLTQDNQVLKVSAQRILLKEAVEEFLWWTRKDPICRCNSTEWSSCEVLRGVSSFVMV